MPKHQKKYRWTKTSATAWAIDAHRTYSATIAYNGVDTYTLTISPGPTVILSSTLKRAKGNYRKYLHDKS